MMLSGGSWLKPEPSQHVVVGRNNGPRQWLPAPLKRSQWDKIFC